MGDVIIVGSGKGGVGKTTVTVNLGHALAELGKSVIIIDGSLTTPDVSLQLGVPLHIRGLSHILKEKANIGSASFNHHSGMRIIPGNVHIDLLDEFEGRGFRRLLSKLKREYDYVLVDSAAGLGREALSALKNCDKMLVVTNPELASVVNSSKAIQLAKSFNVKPIGVVINRIGRFKQELKPDAIAPLLHRVPVLVEIPEHKKIPISAKNSQTILHKYPRSRISRKFRKLAHRLSRKKKVNFWKRIFKK